MVVPCLTAIAVAIAMNMALSMPCRLSLEDSGGSRVDLLVVLLLPAAAANMVKVRSPNDLCGVHDRGQLFVVPTRYFGAEHM